MPAYDFRPGPLSASDAQALTALARRMGGLDKLQVRPPLGILRQGYDGQPVIFLSEAITAPDPSGSGSGSGEPTGPGTFVTSCNVVSGGAVVATRLTFLLGDGRTYCEDVPNCSVECDPSGSGSGGVVAGTYRWATIQVDSAGRVLDASDGLPFVASGAGHDIGLVPDPGSTAGTGRFLCEDATWKTPHEIVFTPASGNTDLVALGQPVGTWTDVTGASWTVATAGTYEVWSEVSAGVNNTVAGADLRGRIVVNGTLSAGTETLPVYGATASASYIQHSSSNPVQLTLAVSDVVKLQVQRNGAGAWALAICYANANLTSGLFARRVG